MQAAKTKRAQNCPLAANFVCLLQYQRSVGPQICLHFVSSLGVHTDRISLAVSSHALRSDAPCSVYMFRRFGGRPTYILRVTE
jgi:hypothetical protein